DRLALVRNTRIGFVFQSFNLLSRTSALENVELPMLYAGVQRDERARRARAILEQVGLGDRLAHKPSELSGGQQQRVAVARALANGAPLLMADEPTGNLDSASSADIMALFRHLNAERGITVVVVTHDMQVAAWSNRVVTFRDGLITDDRPVDAVIPASVRPSAGAPAEARARSPSWSPRWPPPRRPRKQAPRPSRAGPTGSRRSSGPRRRGRRSITGTWRRGGFSRRMSRRSGPRWRSSAAPSRRASSPRAAPSDPAW